MQYANFHIATFRNRPNRFLANVTLNGTDTIVHVKNTGRCKELLLPGAGVVLTKSENPNRKTTYDLIGVYHKEKLFNIDSQAPNQAVGEWLKGQDFDLVKPEYTYGQSRVDFYMERGGERYLMEVKGCTLEIEGVGYFPDAPTERGIKHLKELAAAQKFGYHTYLAFVIQMEGVSEVRPNMVTHPEFGIALKEAKQAGLKVLFLQTKVEPGALEIVSPSFL